MTATSIPMTRPETLAMREHVPIPVAAFTGETLDSERLLNGHREILIRHGDRVYRLRHTSNDKLILTK